jgi:hypothetical protein
VADKRLQTRLDKITGDLTEGLGELSGTLAPMAPVAAITMAMQGPPAMEALVRIASDYPRFLDGLEKAAKTVPFVTVAKFIAAMVLAVVVDMGRAVPEGFAAETLGVAAAAQAAGWTPPQQHATVEGFAAPTPPTRRFSL